MNKIGITSTGMVIVEMTGAEFEALQQLSQPKAKPAEKQPFTPDVTGGVKYSHAGRG